MPWRHGRSCRSNLVAFELYLTRLNIRIFDSPWMSHVQSFCPDLLMEDQRDSERAQPALPQQIAARTPAGLIRSAYNAKPVTIRQALYYNEANPFREKGSNPVARHASSRFSHFAAPVLVCGAVWIWLFSVETIFGSLRGPCWPRSTPQLLMALMPTKSK
jgi:hypothetical protein